MTNTAVNVMLATTNVYNLCAAVVTDNPLIEFFRNNLSIGALLAVFWWREAKSRERYERLYDEERKSRLAAEKKCSECSFTKRANELLLDDEERKSH